MISIKQLDEFCRLHNTSIKFNKEKKVNGFYANDYVVGYL